VLELQVVGRQAAQTTRSVRHYGMVTGTGPITDGNAALQEFAVKWAALAWTDWIAPLSTQWSLQYLQCQWISPTRFRLGRFTADDLGLPDTGSIAQPAIPTTCAGVISLYQPNAGRANQGRTFLPGIASTLVANSSLTGAGQTALQVIGQDLKTSVALTAQPATMIPTLLKSGWTNVNSKNIFTYDVGTPLRVQRRREVGRGE
jgi:hypothetical protein